MSTTVSQPLHETCDRDKIAGLCRKAASTLEESFGKPPKEIKREVDRVENLAAGLRDCFIGLLRADQGRADSPWRGPLDDANVVISLIAAVEYPAAGVHRKYMEQAKEIIDRILRRLPA